MIMAIGAVVKVSASPTRRRAAKVAFENGKILSVLKATVVICLLRPVTTLANHRRRVDVEFFSAADFATAKGVSAFGALEECQLSLLFFWKPDIHVVFHSLDLFVQILFGQHHFVQISSPTSAIGIDEARTASRAPDVVEPDHFPTMACFHHCLQTIVMCILVTTFQIHDSFRTVTTKEGICGIETN
jgi:hypothetical protein